MIIIKVTLTYRSVGGDAEEHGTEEGPLVAGGGGDAALEDGLLKAVQRVLHLVLPLRIVDDAGVQVPRDVLHQLHRVPPIAHYLPGIVNK